MHKLSTAYDQLFAFARKNGALGLLSLVWLLIYPILIAIAALVGPRDPLFFILAGAGFVPAVAGIWPGVGRQVPGQVLVLVLWVVLAVLMIACTGGLAGPYAIWLIMPLGLAAGLERKVAPLEAIGLTALALLALVVVTHQSLLPEPQMAWASPWTAAVSGLVVMAVVLASLLALRGRAPVVQRVEKSAPLLVGFDPVLVCDPAGRVVRIQDDSGSILEPHHVGEPLIDLIHREDQAVLAQAWSDVWQSGASHAVVRLTHKAGLWVEVRLHRQNGIIVGQMTDVSLWKEAERVLMQARDEAISSSAAKSRFLANMSHELRTPLNAIIGFSDVMKQAMFGPLSTKYTEYAELIHDSGLHLLDLIGDVLDMSKIEADKYTLNEEVFDVVEAVSDCLKLTRRSREEAKLKLETVLPDGAVMVRADRRAIKQMVLNLISNAIKFTPEEGQITVRLIDQERDLVLSVADNGQGISPEDLKRIGRPYEQAGGAMSRAMGTGLGLSLVQALAQKHNGTMRIESVMGAGTTVSLTLPILTRVAAVPVEREPDKGPAQQLIEQAKALGVDLARGEPGGTV